MIPKWLKRKLKPLVTDLFHHFYYHNSGTWLQNTFLGYPIQQCPFDLHLYQELIVRLKPRFIIQTGVADGGSVLYHASMLDLIGADSSTIVIGVDISLTPSAKSLSHPRIHLVEGNSISVETIQLIKDILPSKQGGLVSLDSDHTKKHVLEELRIYSDFVAVGSYLVCEDTNINGHPVARNWGDGPFEAVEAFIKKDSRFIRDDDLWKRNLLSFHQFGWLKKIADD